MFSLGRYVAWKGVWAFVKVGGWLIDGVEQHSGYLSCLLFTTEVMAAGGFFDTSRSFADGWHALMP